MNRVEQFLGDGSQRRYLVLENNLSIRTYTESYILILGVCEYSVHRDAHCLEIEWRPLGLFLKNVSGNGGFVSGGKLTFYVVGYFLRHVGGSFIDIFQKFDSLIRLDAETVNLLIYR